MTRHHLLSAMLSILIVAAFVFGVSMRLVPRGVPMNLSPLDEHVALITAVPDHPLPPGIEAGDRIDLRQQEYATRIASFGGPEPLGQVINVVVERDSGSLSVPVTVVEQGDNPLRAWSFWFALGVGIFLAGIGLLLVWRGRDRAAFGMGLWAITVFLSTPMSLIPLHGWLELVAVCISALLFLTARVGFYIMVEARMGAALSPRQRNIFRACFAVLLVLGAVRALGGPLLVVLAGSAELQSPEYGLMLTASYFVPIAMLCFGYFRAAVSERQRLRWMLASGISWVTGILLQNTPVFGDTASAILSDLLLDAALIGFLYAVLKHRVVDIAVVIDRALVYGLMTTLVVGVVAAVNSLALRETLAPGAGLVLQVVVPLALGIVLGRVREFMDRFVEQVFFRSKYLAEKTLRTFARHVEHMEDAPALLDATVREIRRTLKAPSVAIYSAEGPGYLRVKHSGDAGFPERLTSDDATLVALRAEQKAVDLANFESSLGSDGCAFPMMVLGRLRGVLVCTNRPGEHYAADEKELLTQVAREVGATWRILRARDNEAYVRAMAEGELTLKSAREKAKALALAWRGT